MVIVCCCTFAVSPAGAQEARRLALAEAVRLAQQHSPLAQGAEARARGAEARLRGAGALPNPSLSLAQPFGKNTGGTDEDILLTQTVELGDKQRQRRRAARAEREAALAERAATTFDLVLTAQTAYYEALRADAERRLAADALATAQTFAQAAATQFQAGDAARSHVLRSRIELARAQQALDAAETERANRYAALRSLTGLPEDTALVLTDSLAYTPVSYRLPDLQTLALRSRPDLLAAQRLREARAAALHGARAQSQPDLFLEARHSTLDPTVGGNSLRVGLLFPLFDLGRNRADIRAAQSALQEQEALVQEAARTARLEVETAFRNLEQARRTVESFQTGRLQQAKELQEMAQIGYDKGATTYLELLDALQVYRNEQTDYARALADYNIAKATLQRAVGGTLP
jgi:cobalt-zinc-cadmium efflux system outer membrane protein